MRIAEARSAVHPLGTHFPAHRLNTARYVNPSRIENHHWAFMLVELRSEMTRMTRLPRQPRFDRARYQFSGILLHEMIGFRDRDESQVALHKRPVRLVCAPSR